jgi:hypothetical protein
MSACVYVERIKIKRGCELGAVGGEHCANTATDGVMFLTLTSACVVTV